MYYFSSLLCVFGFMLTSFVNSEYDQNKSNDSISMSSTSKSNEISDLADDLVNLKNSDDELKSDDKNITKIQTCTKSTNMKSNYSYTVSIQKKGSHYASGALIGEKWILTAAGPFYNIRESIKLLKARLGSVDDKNGGIIVPIKEIVIHPLYINGRPNFDLTLLRIAKRGTVEDTHVTPISLSKEGRRVLGGEFQTTYWPRLIVNKKLLSRTAKERTKPNNLRVSIQNMIPQYKCADTFKQYNYTLSRSVLCLEPITAFHSPCTPDVGAPVTIIDHLWGITSGWVSEDCSKNVSPTVFNRVSLPFTRDWIESIIESVNR